MEEIWTQIKSQMQRGKDMEVHYWWLERCFLLPFFEYWQKYKHKYTKEILTQIMSQTQTQIQKGSTLLVVGARRFLLPFFKSAQQPPPTFNPICIVLVTDDGGREIWLHRRNMNTKNVTNTIHVTNRNKNTKQKHTALVTEAKVQRKAKTILFCFR